MADKTLNTRIVLKHGTLAEWQAGKYNKSEYLKAGEVAVVTLGTDVETNHPADTTNTHPILFKVGTGAHHFDALPWASALAADVYDWAKKSEADFITWVNTVVEHPAAPDLTPYLIASDITTGGANGTIAIRGTDVAVKGLGSAAYTDSNAYAPADIDTGVHAVNLAGGTDNGTLKLTVDGTATDNIAVTGLGDLAFKDSLSKTDVGLGNVDNTADVDKPVSTAQAAAIKEAKDRADEAYTLAETKADAATTYNKTEVNGLIAPLATTSALNEVRDTANAANTKIDTFLGTVTPDGSADIIDTLSEINQYVGKHGEEFALLSGRVGDLEKKPGLDKVGTVISITAGDGLDGGTITESGTIALNAATKASLAKADTALQTHQDISHLATEEDLTKAEERIETLENKPAASITTEDISAWDAEKGANAAIAALGTMAKEDKANYYTKTEADGAFATAAQGELADSALQEITADATFEGATISGLKVTNKNNIEIDESVTFILNCGGAND